MTNNLAVLRTENNGVEFFTLSETGESGMSQSGLARACGITKQSLSELVAKIAPSGKSQKKDLKPATDKGLALSGKTPQKTLKTSTDKGFNPSGKTHSKWLKPFLGKNLNLTTNCFKNGGLVTVYSAKFCAAVIKHYAYSGSEQAQDFDSELGIIGLTSYIQSQTGWLPEKFKAAPEAHKKLSEFLDLATEWDRGVMLKVDDEGYEIDMSDSWTFFDAVTFAGFTVKEFVKFQDENRLLELQSHSKNEQVKLFLERNPVTAKRLQPYMDNVKKMLTVKSPRLFHTIYFETYGRTPNDSYWELFQSAIDYKVARHFSEKS